MLEGGHDRFPAAQVAQQVRHGHAPIGVQQAARGQRARGIGQFGLRTRQPAEGTGERGKRRRAASGPDQVASPVERFAFECRRDAFVDPGGHVAAREAPDQRVRELVGEDAIEFLLLLQGPPHRDADGSVVGPGRPARRTRDVPEFFGRVEHDRNRVGRKTIQRVAHAPIRAVECLEGARCKAGLLRSFEGHREVVPDGEAQAIGDRGPACAGRPVLRRRRERCASEREKEGREGRPHNRIILTVVSWLSTFTRFRPGRTPLVGPVALLVADWSRPQRGSAPMFDSPVLERLSVVHPAFPTLVYLPAGLLLFWRSAAGPLGPWITLLLYAAGLLAWSLLEYGAHRGSFHHEPQNEGQLAFGYLVHGVHHAYPDDSRRWMMPLAVTI